MGLILLCGFSFNDSWNLLYRGSRDGFGAQNFHSKCNGHHSPSLTIVKAKKSKYVFGGYTEAVWDCSNQYKTDPKAFLISLINKDNLPCKMATTNPEFSIYCGSQSGPVFGGADLFISFTAHKSFIDHRASTSVLGTTYKHPFYVFENDEQASRFLAGSYKFRLDDIEVYSKE